MRARYYLPLIDRFISRDPAGGGVNPYLYAGDSPTNFTDPTGMDQAGGWTGEDVASGYGYGSAPGGGCCANDYPDTPGGGSQNVPRVPNHNPLPPPPYAPPPPSLPFLGIPSSGGGASYGAPSSVGRAMPGAPLGLQNGGVGVAYVGRNGGGLSNPRPSPSPHMTQQQRNQAVLLVRSAGLVLALAGIGVFSLSASPEVVAVLGGAAAVRAIGATVMLIGTSISISAPFFGGLVLSAQPSGP